MSKRLKRNAVLCLHCNTEIESMHPNNPVACNCPQNSTTRIFIDGGLEARRIGFGDHALFHDLCEYFSEDNENGIN